MDPTEVISNTNIVDCPTQVTCFVHSNVYICHNTNVGNKNSNILPTGQWYAPSAVINDALIMTEYARLCQSMPEYARVCQSMPE